MKSKIMDLFITSGKVITSADELFYLKNQESDNMGIIISIIFPALLGIIIGLLTFNPIIAIGTIVALIVITLFSNFIKTIFIYIFTHLLKAEGGFFKTFNMISYASALDIFIIVAFALAQFRAVFLLFVILVGIWKAIIQIAAVNTVYDIGYVRSYLCYSGFLAIIAIIILGLI
ncbi:hypothetical protein [Methanosphaera cuniculi]|uniref:hypothetical protein n=1 Tax=Methanosphaera cuniculi TaxID=1077256 RepID=UPI0026DC0EB9|nr:hypothetical protein [Methanosphaera cuniculi]